MSKILGITFVAAAMGGGFYIWRKQKADQAAQQAQIVHYANTPAPQPSSSGGGGSSKLPLLLGAGAALLASQGAFSGLPSLGGIFGGAGSGTSDGGNAVLNSRFSGGQDIGPGGVNFAEYEQKYDLPKGYLRRTAQIESAMNPNAKNPNSSAGGLFQFIDSTARTYGLSNKYDPKQATDAASRLARDNSNTLRPVLSRNPTGAELYLAHQQGGGGAKKLLRNRNARAVDVVGYQQVKLNGGNSNMTAGQFADLWINKFNRGFA